MRHPRRPSPGVIILVAGFLFASVFAVSYANRPDPPLEAVNRAHAAIQKAGKGPAATYFPEKIVEAERLLDRSRSAINAESQRIYFLRDYGSAARSAESAAKLAGFADSAGIALHDSLRVACDEAIRAAERALADLDHSLQRMPREKQYRQRVTRYQVAVAGSLNLRKEEAYRESIRLANTVIEDAGRLEDTVHQRYAGWTASASKWREWARETIQWSRSTGEAAIIVRKVDHTLDLYVGGKMVQRFDADLGTRWMGDKLHRGDNATPEGRYRITKKKGPSETRYYKALLLNYPNEEDLRTFREAKRQGRIPKGAGIGSLIEIHGDGGRGEDWTQGCVALDNHDMDRLFARVGVGTPVTIIGSDGDL